MASVSTPTPSVDDIRRSMAQIRQRLHEDMQGVVAGAEAASDWKRYVRMYPLAAMTVALGLGYLVVPRRQRSATKTAEKTAQAVVDKLIVAAPVSAPPPPPAPASPGIFSGLMGMITPIAMKAAQNYAMNYVGSLMDRMQGPAGPPREDFPFEPASEQRNQPPFRRTDG